MAFRAGLAASVGSRREVGAVGPGVALPPGMTTTLHGNCSAFFPFRTALGGASPRRHGAKMILPGFAVLVALAGCIPRVTDTGKDGGPGPTPTPGVDGGVVLLSPTDRLVRAAMALKGTRPTVAELATVAADPDALASIVDSYTDSPEFLATMRDLHAEDFLVRSDRFVPPAAGSLDGFLGGEINASITEEPLALVEYVIANGKPYTEIVTADYTLADPIVARMWGIPYPGAGVPGQWKVTQFDDGRPHAGILSSTGLFMRHETAGGNYNRARANMVSRSLICFDFAAADVNIDTSIDAGNVENAVKTNPACQTCHADLDPIAGFFFGWEDRIRPARLRGDAEAGINPYPVPFYFPAREDGWQTTTDVRPKWFGVNGNDLADLGQLIAADPSFATCAAKRFYGYFSHADRDEVPTAIVTDLAARFIASGFDAKALARDAVLLDAFNVSYSNDADAAEEVDGFKRARPEQIGRLLRDLTGYEWRTDASINQGGYAYGTVDVTKNDTIGMRTLAGGIDSVYVNAPSRTWNSTTSLFLRTFAAGAAGTVVDADFAVAASQRKLLAGVEPATTGEAAIRAQLVSLHARLYGEIVAADSPEVDDAWDLFSASLAASGNDATLAWKTTLTAMLQDLRIAYY